MLDMAENDLKRDVEAVLFAAGRPLSLEEILRALAAAAGDGRDGAARPAAGAGAGTGGAEVATLEGRR